MFDDGAFTTAEAGFAVRWVQGDPFDQVVDFEYRVTVDAAQGSELRPWTRVGRVEQIDVQGLPALEGASYFFHVRAVLVDGVTDSGVTDGIVLDRTAPELLAFDDGEWTRASSSLAASWSAEDAGAGVAAYSYAIGRTPSAQDVVPWTPIGQRTQITATGLTLEDGVTYYWQVEARDGVGNALRTAADGVTVDRTAPTVTVTDQGDFGISPDRLSANWTTVDPNPLALVEYALGTNADQEALVPWTATGRSNIVLTGLPLVDGERYVFRVRATDAAGNQGLAAADGIRIDLTPPDLGELGYSPYLPTDDEVILSWFAPDGVGVPVARYLYGLGSQPGRADIVPVTNAGLTTSVVMQDLTLDNGRAYYGLVLAIDEVGRRTQRVTGAMVVDLSPPQIQFINDDGDFTADGSALRFDWSAVDGETEVVDYEYSLGVPGDPDALLAPVRTTAQSITIADLVLEEGQTYVLGLTAYDVLGYADFGVSDGIAVDVTPPRITQLEDDGQVTGRTDRLSMRWAGSDTPSGIAQYEFAFGTAPELVDDVVPWQPIGLETSVTVEGLSLTEGTTYYGAVRASDQAGNAELAVTDGIRVDTAPPSIANLRADSITETTATLRWETSKPTTTHLVVTPQEGPSQEILLEQLTADHALLLTQLFDGTRYAVRIDSTDDAGVAGEPAEVQFETLAGESRAEQISPPGVSYADPEIYSAEGLVTFRTALGDVWVGNLDPLTGRFVRQDGREYLMDTDSETGGTINGPEFGLDQDGWSIFYAKRSGEEVQVWRATLNEDGTSSAGVLTSGTRHQTAMPTLNGQRTTTKVVNIIGSWETGGDIAWFDEQTPNQQNVFAQADSFLTNRNPGRWMADGRRIVMVDEDTGQLFLLNTDTGGRVVITDDAGFKTAPQGFRAPEYDERWVVTAVIDDSTIGVYLDPGDGGIWPRVDTLTVPVEASDEVFSSPEVFHAGGKSWLVLTVKDRRTGEGAAQRGEIWVLDLEGDPRMRYARRCDDGRPDLKRSDPEVYVGEQEAFVYYNLQEDENTSSLWRCRTGIASDGDHPRARTSVGVVQGITSPAANAHAWLAIPFASPPVGAARLTQPVLPEPWTPAVRQAGRYAGACPQPDPSRPDAIIGDEDCLYLNVFTPVGAAEAGEALPVMFFVHGGANRTGSTDSALSQLLDLEAGTGGPIFDGARLAALGNVVVVTTNYRLAALGNLTLAELAQESPTGTAGNYGMFDLLAALEWVQKEIDAFGGDPSRVLLFGQSAGAHNVGMLVASPLAAGLFSRAIMQSGVMSVDTAEEASADAAAFVEEMGLTGAADLPAALRDLPIERIVLARTALPLGYGEFTFYPHVDGVVVDDQPLDRVLAGLHNDVPLVVGTNSEEYLHDFSDISLQEFYDLAAEMVPEDRLGELLGLYPLENYADPAAAYAAMVTDRNLTSSMRTVARGFSTQRSPVYRYHFRRMLSTPARKADGAYHATELLYLFQHMEGREFEADTDDRAVEQLLRELWTRFASTGDPNVVGLPAWPPYEVDTDPYLLLDVVPSAQEALEPLRSDFWDSIKLGDL